MRQKAKDDEKRENECSHYDWRDHEWYYSKRPLNGREKIKLQESYKKGESKGTILKRMGLLKN